MPPIQRINFFDGLFLKQGEFHTEQYYHQHMRRRVNFMLFESSGVVQLDPGNLRVTPTAAKRFLVTAGMALSHRPDLSEGREVVLADDSAELDLAALGFSGADEAVVAIHYEDGLSQPQTGVDPATETRIDEQALVTVHNAADPWPPAAPLPDGEQYIRLGQIRFSDMNVAETPAERQTAAVRSALFGGAPSPAPTISNISPNSGAPGDSIVGAIIAGTNLASVTTPDVTAPAADIAGIVVNSSTATTVDLDFDVQPGATAGAKIITVTTPDGIATVPFTVVVAAPVVVDSFSPAFRVPGQQVTVSGTNIRNAADANGTVVHLVDSVNTAQVRATISPVDFLSDSGGFQRIRFNAPVAADVSPVPSSPSVEQFRIRVDFGGGQGLSPLAAGNLSIQF